MRAASREQIERAVDKGSYSVRIGDRTLSIRERRGRYEITIIKDGKKPDVWLYRKKPIAIDRFEEQCDYFRRGAQAPKEKK